MSRVADIVQIMPPLQLEFAGYIPQNQELTTIRPLCEQMKANTTRYPSWVYEWRKSYPDVETKFISLLEVLTTRIIQQVAIVTNIGNVPPVMNDWRMSIIDIWRSLGGYQFVEASILEPKSMAWLNKLEGYLHAAFGGHQVQLNPIYRYQDIETTVNIVAGGNQGYAINILSTSTSTKLIKPIVKLLADVAVLRENGIVVNYAGLLLPVQKTTFYMNVSAWDHKRFAWRIQFSGSNLLYQGQRFAAGITRLDIGDAILHYVGNCVSRGGITVGEACTRLPTNRVPFQMYIQTQGDSRNIPDYELLQAAEVVRQGGLRVYSHAPLSFNFASRNTNRLQMIASDVRYCRLMGLKGSVVHMGQASDTDYVTALNNMEFYVRQAMVEATPETPILLETSASEGNDICCDPVEFAAFYNRFNEEERKRVKICVDTCHVYSAGFHPMLWLTTWTKYFPPSSIGLIHYNDSETMLGGCNDAHHYFVMHNGKIGMEEMYEVFLWAQSNNIDCVIE